MISETSLVAEQTAFLNLLCRGPECGNIIKYSIAGKKVKRTSASSRTEALVSTVNNGNLFFQKTGRTANSSDYYSY